jgi:hypothetical protein
MPWATRFHSPSRRQNHETPDGPHFGPTSKIMVLYPPYGTSHVPWRPNDYYMILHWKGKTDEMWKYLLSPSQKCRYRISHTQAATVYSSNPLRRGRKMKTSILCHLVTKPYWIIKSQAPTTSGQLVLTQTACLTSHGTSQTFCPISLFKGVLSLLIKASFFSQ